MLVIVAASCGGGGAPPAAVLQLPPSPSASVAKAPAPVCDDDTTEPFDCKTLALGDCSAGTYYACPQSSGMPAGMGLRPKVAADVARCLARPGYPTDIQSCVKPLEACVREAVGISCADDEAIATCKKELATCSPDLQMLCAKLLTSLQPKTRASALEDMHGQRRGDSCAFSWDLNGFPFCPYCPFRP